MKIIKNTLEFQINNWMEEEHIEDNFYYLKKLPSTPVKLHLKIKSDLILCGLDYFSSVFETLGACPNSFSFLENWDGKKFSAGEEIEFPEAIPFNIALCGERLALNLLQHASSISTWTKRFVDLASPVGIKILDTRKTTPGLRSLEKYAVRVGGGFNHRLSQTDVWMIKDNHKVCMGGLEGALKFFQSMGSAYSNTVVEIHSLDELNHALHLGVRHMLLDNFTPDMIKKSILIKKADVTYEISGGIKLENLNQYLISGVDYISLGSLTYSAPRVDISLKYKPI